jgi:hypothetical protein
MQIEEINLSQAKEQIGNCGETIMRKAEFGRLFKRYELSADLTSEEFQFNIDSNVDQISSYLDENNLSRLGTRIEMCALNIGVIAENAWDDDINPLEDKLYSRILDLIIKETKATALRGYKKMLANNIPVTFNVTSSTGYCSETNDQFNCAHSVSSKVLFLDEYIKGNAKKPAIPSIIAGLRAQCDTEEKCNLRPSTYFSGEPFSHQLEKGTVTNDHHGFRMRYVMGYPWLQNIPLIGYSACIFAGIHDSELLNNAWEFTHASLQDKYKGTFITCSDISNNDLNFIWAENKYIHHSLLGPIFEDWLNVYEHGVIYGAYRDNDDKSRYFRQSDFKKPLLSGEGLTSITNKIKHTTMQMYNYVRLEKNLSLEEAKSFDKMSESELFEMIVKRSYFMNNNGDDTIDSFDNQEDTNKFTEIMLENPYAVVGLEPPSFSGISMQLSSDHKVSHVYANMKSLFIKGMETERRSYTSNLGRLPYNSLIGKTKFMCEFVQDDPTVVTDALELYYKLNNFFGDTDDLEDLARKEVIEAAKQNDRQTSIWELANKIGEPDPAKLFYKYSTEELMKACPTCFENLFIHKPVEQIFPGNLVDYLEASI